MAFMLIYLKNSLPEVAVSMSSRVAQVLYTATSLQPNAKVWIDIEGKPLEVLGGEGLLLEQPDLESFEKLYALALVVLFR